LLLLLVALSGCSYTTTLGPEFAPVATDSSKSIVYLYRPEKLVAWMKPVHVAIDGEERIVMVGGYAVMAVTPGPHRVLAYSTYTAQNYITYGHGPSKWSGITDISPAAGDSIYIRLGASFGSTEVTQVPAAEAMDEIRGLSLTPGGALR
jgi:hypothetical protein